MLDIGFSELLMILAVALIVLGPKKLPEVARSLGRGLAQFRRASEDLRRSILVEEKDWEKERPVETLPRPSSRQPADELPAQDRDPPSSRYEPAEDAPCPPASDAAPKKNEVDG